MSALGRALRGAGLRERSGEVMVEKLFDGMFEPSTESGEVVTIDKSLTLPAVFRAIRLISESGGALPLVTYRKSADGESRDRAATHPAYGLLHDKPNPGMDAVEFWTMVLAHFAGWGKLFIGKEFAGNRVVALHAIHPKNVKVERRKDGSLIFRERRNGGLSEKVWSQGEVIYSRLFTLDGIDGISPIGMQRETMGLGLAMRKHGARFFNDSAIPSGALSVEQEIKDPDVRDRLRKEWKARHQGRRDIAILDAGAKFETISVPLKDAQYVELAGLGRADVADAFNMPASLLNGQTGDSLTYGNRADDVLQFLTFTLHNPLRKLEQALGNDRDLFPQTNTFFTEFLREDLLRPDSLSRARFYTLALNQNSGWMERDEVRQRENLPKLGTTTEADPNAGPDANPDA